MQQRWTCVAVIGGLAMLAAIGYAPARVIAQQFSDGFVRKLTFSVDSRTIASNGIGTAATLTLTPISSYVALTCNDTDGCTITMGESGIHDGMLVTVTNVSANACAFADSAGVSELNGAFSMAQWESLTLQYVTDRWVERARTTASVVTASSTTTFTNKSGNISQWTNDSGYLTSVTESNLSLSDVTTANVSTTKHGLTPKLPNDSSQFLDGTGAWSVPAGGGGGAPTGASYVTLGTDATLSAERVLTAGTGITITDGGAGSTVTIAASGSGSGDTYVVKPSDESRNTTTTLTDDTDLKFPIGTSGTYFAEFFVMLVDGSTGTADWKFAFTGPSGATIKGGTLGRDNGTYWSNAALATNPTTLGTGTFFHGGGTSATNPNGLYFAVIVISGGTSGNITLQWAQNTSNGSNNTVKAKSFVRYRQIV